MKGLAVSLFLLLALVIWVPADAQQHPNDLGIADTVDVEFSVVPDVTTGEMKLQADLWVYNDANTVVGVSVGFVWDNPNLQMDSAVASSLTETGFDLGRFFYEDDDINVTNQNQHFLFGGARIFGSGVQPAAQRQLWASYYFTLTDWNDCDSVVIDTLQFNNGTEYQFVSETGDYQPYYVGAERHRDTACVAPSNLLLSTDSLYFAAIEGGTSPSPQQFTVSSDGDPLSFNLIESIPWAIPSPIGGTTQQQINVLTNITGLSAGTYVDSIRVESAGAANSPLYVKLVLDIEEPPPVIGVVPEEFFFNAIAGGSNPASKILTITNDGGQVLNWTVSNNSSWLSLSPTMGMDSGDVTVSVDITGLGFNDYYDTIWVSDPAASNDSVGVPVTLSVASDLPVIAVDSAFNFVPTAPVVFGPTQTITIRNAGAGSMNWWIEENSTRLSSITPSSGSAPADVEIGLKLGGNVGDFFDTLWVYSNEAINSPFPVVFQIHVVEDPAEMYIGRDTVHLTVFECEMGVGNALPFAGFQVQNLGGDDPMSFTVSGESDYFDINVIVPVAPASVTLTAKYNNLPQGTYYDTVIVSAYKSIVPADTVYVAYSVSEGIEPPRIWVSKFSYQIPAQENGGPIPSPSLTIRNDNPGCMEWFIQESIPWLTPVDTTGLNPATPVLNIDASGYTIGEYPDSMKIIAPEATNTPGTIRMRLQIWRFHGDVEWDGDIDVADLTYMVSYLFKQGPEPKPERRTGDLNCTRTVDVSDLTYFVDYLFRQGPIPCGNPYK